MFKLALSAGHGFNTTGKRCLEDLDSNQTREWWLNNRICRKIEDILKDYRGIQILRLDDTSGKSDIPLKSRTDKANTWGADFYLAVHHNAGINRGTGGGIEAYIYPKASKQSQNWQIELYNALIKNTSLKGNRQNGLREKNLHEVRESKMPAVLIECGFMDSATDVPIILSDTFAQSVAEACCEVIIAKGGLINKEDKNVSILNWQNSAIIDGFKFPKYGADGHWGKECEAVASKAVCKKRNSYKYKSLTKIVQKTVGTEVDGKFGDKTRLAVIEYQKNKNLTPDGCVGLKTWKKILGVKQ